MALLPDLAAAGLLAVVLFFLALGFLVVFVEAIRPSRFVAGLAASVGIGGALIVLGEVGLGLVAFAPAWALVAKQVFEWLTTR